jgi:hypothetical protein
MESTGIQLILGVIMKYENGTVYLFKKKHLHKVETIINSYS